MLMVMWLFYRRACGLRVYRMLKKANRMSVPSEATHATVRPTSELWPDFQGGSDLTRWLPRLVCREGKCCDERSTGTSLSECSMRVGSLVHPCRVKYFRKAVSVVMDDLVKCAG